MAPWDGSCYLYVLKNCPSPCNPILYVYTVHASVKSARKFHIDILLIFFLHACRPEGVYWPAYF